MYRLRDILFSIIFLILFSWLFILIILLLVLTQKRIFFTQERTGLNEIPFRVIKFSTLRDSKAGMDESADQKKRLTFIGKILRRFSLDEMPQLINILKGEMSFVGPRPLIQEYLGLYSEEQKKRFKVRPGITGWAQINGRNRISFTERFKLDCWYVENRSLWLDLKIFFLSLVMIFRNKDVYQNAGTTSERFDGRN